MSVAQWWVDGVLKKQERIYGRHMDRWLKMIRRSGYAVPATVDLQVGHRNILDNEILNHISIRGLLRKDPEIVIGWFVTWAQRNELDIDATTIEELRRRNFTPKALR